MLELERAYWAGAMDSDGSFSLTISITRTANPSIIITPNAKIAWKEIYFQTLIDAKEKYGFGKIYFSNKGKPDGTVMWQSTNLDDAIKFCEFVHPYLTIKKERVTKFIEICKYWRDSQNHISGKRIEGSRTRSKEDIEKIVKIAVTLNEGRQTERWREWRGWDYWKPIIDKLYGDLDKVQEKRKSRSCSNCKSNSTYTDKKGGERWYKSQDGFLCNSCFLRKKRSSNS